MATCSQMLFSDPVFSVLADQLGKNGAFRVLRASDHEAVNYLTTNIGNEMQLLALIKTDVVE